MSIKVILIHGNGGGTGHDHWAPYVQNELTKLGIETLSPDMPDPFIARAIYWLPFLESLGADENTILIGHSSGATAAMKYAETHKLFGTILVGAYHTTLGYDEEKQSGYFDEPWNWEAIKSNNNWIVQFASTDDPWIPIEEARYVATNLNTEYHEYENRGHFGAEPGRPDTTELPEIVEVIKQKLNL